jgi:hypothetical protein
MAAYKAKFGSRKRDAIWQCECLAAWRSGRGRLPICNLCDTPVLTDEPWHESHHPDHPRVFGGKSVGVAHALCNLLHGANVVKPAVDKCNRVRDRHLGLKGPGLGRYPMKAGRRSRFTKTMRRGLQQRTTQAEKLAATLTRRAFAPEAPTQFDQP